MNKLILTLLALTFLLPTKTNGQGWEKIYDNGNNDYGFSAKTTPDGGLIMLGTEWFFSDTIKEPFLHQMDALGNLIWEYHDYTHEDSVLMLHEVIITSDGNYLISFEHAGGLNHPRTTVLQKIIPNGTVLWTQNWESNRYLGAIEETSTGELIILSSVPIDTAQTIDTQTIIKLDNMGNPIWSKSLSGEEVTSSILVAANDDILVTIYKDFERTSVYRLDSNDGATIWEQDYELTNTDFTEFPRDLVELSTGEIVVGVSTEMNIPNGYQHYPTLLKIDATGDEISKIIYHPTKNYRLSKIEKAHDDGIVMFGRDYEPTLPEHRNLYLSKVDTDGNVLWDRTYGTANYEWPYDVVIADDNGFYLLGQSIINGSNISRVYVIKTDSLGYSFTNQFVGNFYEDENLDCNYDTAEMGLTQWHIEAEKGPLKYHTITDADGNFDFLLDTGTYQISTYPISPYWELCIDSFTIDFTTIFDTQVENIGAQVIVECPLLDISIGTPFLRRCFENTYTVNYCNYGTIPAEDAYVEIDFDADMIILNTSIPIASQSGNFLTFDIGDVPVSDCGSFTVDILLQDTTNCDSILLGATHCVIAHIYPDSICLPTNDWSGASIEVDALCVGDSIHFEIRNVGGASSDPNLQYSIIEDDVIIYFEGFGLNPNEVLPISVAANGGTFRLEADQEPNHPGMSMPSVSVEGCNINFGDPHLGFVNIFTQNDGDPFVDIDCQANVGAYDPNDKQGFPLGYGSEHFINRGQDIEYLIRFQNTGTDTAFNIRVEDKLSELLNITSVRPGASSHRYEFSVLQDRTLQFKFDNIMLPDSNVNQYASNGFIKFKVSQMPDLELGTQIHNSASIYFDFNAPIITNQTLHTLGENYITITTSIDPIESQLVDVKIYPNPFSIETKIELEGMEIDQGVFKLFDATGRLIRSQNFNSNQFIFSKKDLRTGMYFFTIENNYQIISSGKLVAQ